MLLRFLERPQNYSSSISFPKCLLKWSGIVIPDLSSRASKLHLQWGLEKSGHKYKLMLLYWLPYWNCICFWYKMTNNKVTTGGMIRGQRGSSHRTYVVTLKWRFIFRIQIKGGRLSKGPTSRPNFQFCPLWIHGKCFRSKSLPGSSLLSPCSQAGLIPSLSSPPSCPPGGSFIQILNFITAKVHRDFHLLCLQEYITQWHPAP